MMHRIMNRVMPSPATVTLKSMLHQLPAQMIDNTDAEREETRSTVAGPSPVTVPNIGRGSRSKQGAGQ